MISSDQLARFKVPVADAIEIAEDAEGGQAYAAECVVEGDARYVLVKMLVEDDMPRLWYARVHGTSGDILEAGEIEEDGDSDPVGDIILLEERLPELALSLAEASRMAGASRDGIPVAITIDFATELLDLQVEVLTATGPAVVVVDGLNSAVRPPN